jgi:hypothetical protein
MPSGWECYHCKQWIEAGEAHDCWTTTEAALTRDLSEDLREAWGRLRETAVEFGEQRIYASHHSIMFSRRSCYFFVRPKRTYLEVCIFLSRPIRSPQVKKVTPSSRTKLVHVVPIRHRDEVEAPVTDWLREAYHLQDLPQARPPSAPKRAEKTAARATTGRRKTTSTRQGTGGETGAGATRRGKGTRPARKRAAKGATGTRARRPAARSTKRR